MRERREVSQPIGVGLVERPCPASVPLVLNGQSGPYIPPYTAAHLQNLKYDVKTMENKFVSKIIPKEKADLSRTYEM